MSTRLARPATGGGLGPRRLTRSDLLAAAACIVVGVAGAACYYSEVFRPLAHTYAIWLLLVVVVSARQPAVRGAIRGGVGLLVSVIAFYYGKQLIYAILYPGPGLPYRVDLLELAQWGTLGLLGEAVLGCLASRIGHAGWFPAAVSATAIALPAVEAYQRSAGYSDVGPVAVVAAVGAVAVLILGERSGRQLLRTVYMVIPGVAAAWVVSSARTCFATSWEAEHWTSPAPWPSRHPEVILLAGRSPRPGPPAGWVQCCRC